MAHAAMKDVAKALEEREQFEAAAAKAQDLPMGNNTSGQVLKVAGRVLSAKVMAARGNKDEARRSFETAVAAQDDLAYDEPPAFPWPVRESMGAFLVLSGEAQAAEQVFREDLARNPNNPRSLFGLSEALRAQRRYEKSEQAKAEFEPRWRGADVKLRLEDF
jgi:tetratricopeptide (TPR) repeat protein